MSDIIYRIAAAAISNAPACQECVDVLVEARDEIESLRLAIRRLAEQGATLSVCDRVVTVTMEDTLTDAEREAISEAISAFDEFAGDEVYAAAMRGLLERMR